VIAQIVDVGPQQHLGQAEGVGARARDVHQLGFAVIAAVGGIGGEAGALELVRVDEVDGRADERRQVARRQLLAGGHRDRDRRQRPASLAEDVVRYPQEKRRIDAARKADQRRAVPADHLAQAGVFFGQRAGERAGAR
jgi:hypothetical protein